MHASIVAILMSLTLNQTSLVYHPAIAKCPKAKEQLEILFRGTYYPEDNIKACSQAMKDCRISWKQIGVNNQVIEAMEILALKNQVKRDFDRLEKGDEYYYITIDSFKRAMFYVDQKTGLLVQRFSFEDIGRSREEYEFALIRSCQVRMKKLIHVLIDERATLMGPDSIKLAIEEERARGGCSPDDVATPVQLAEAGVNP